MRKLFFETGEIYHVYNRGTDKRNIYLKRDDYARFLNYLIDFNSLNPIDKKRVIEEKKKNLKRGEILQYENIDDDPLVDILAFCLMPNHFHLLLRQKVDGGITKFMQRILTGYVMAFNIKQKRTGVLFQGRFKAVHVDKQEYLDYLIFYIHFNPLSLVKDVSDSNGTLNFLNTYEWSSHIDYSFMDKKGSIFVDKEFFFENFKNGKEYLKKSKEWLRIIKEKNNIKNFTAKGIDCE